jgi:hypothetical protein
MLGSVRFGSSLDDLEDSHLCLEADLARRRSESVPFRAQWDGLPGASLRSVGRSSYALGEISAESLDMNTTSAVEVTSGSSC